MPHAARTARAATIALAAAGALTLGPALPAAAAVEGSISDRARDAQRSVDITGVRWRTTDHRTRAVVSVRNLAGTGRLRVHGSQDDSIVHLVVTRREDGSTLKKVEIRSDMGGVHDSWRCPAMGVAWDRAGDTVTVRTPTRCLEPVEWYFVPSGVGLSRGGLRDLAGSAYWRQG